MTQGIGANISTFVCHQEGIQGQGPHDAEVMIVGVAPAREEMRSGEVYSGQTGQLLRAVLRGVGMNISNCYVTNLLCTPSREPTEEQVYRCLPRVVREIDVIKPKVILAVGALPIQILTGHKRTAAVRGSCVWSTDFNCWVIGTWQPTIVLNQSPALISDIVRDVLKINYIKDKPKDFGRVEYRVVDSVDATRTMLRNLPREGFVSLDVECVWDHVKEEWTRELRCLAISDGDNTWVVPANFMTYDPKDWPQDVHWTFHNAMFDTAVMKLHGIDLLICDDTMLMSYSLDERGGTEDEATDVAVGIHGLKRLSREYCGADFYEVDIKRDPDEIVWQYNAKDAAYTARLAKLFCARQVEEGVRDHYLQLTLPQATLCRDEKEFGVHVDIPRLHELTINWGEEWIRLGDELESDAKEYGWPEEKFNPNSPKQLKRFLNTFLMLDVPDTRKETLAKYEGHPWLKKFRRRKRLDKNLNTYVIGTRKNVARDGRVHPDPSIHATTSGRLAYHNPPVGTVPSGAQYINPDEEPDEEAKALITEFRNVRGLFGAPERKVFIEADFNSAELWTAALISRDDQMLKDLLSGDFHSAAAEGMFRCKRTDYSPEHWSGMRRQSKYVTFGVLFFRGAKSLYQPAQGQSGDLGKAGYTLRDLEQMVIAWHQKYNGHYDWAVKEIEQARRTGMQRSITGRVRRYNAPGVYGGHFTNMASNFPVQSVSHDHLIAARLDFQKIFNESDFPAHTLWDGHDACYFEVDESVAAEAIQMIKEVMEKPRWFDLGIPVEIKMGRNWADAKKVA